MNESVKILKDADVSLRFRPCVGHSHVAMYIGSADVCLQLQVPHGTSPETMYYEMAMYVLEVKSTPGLPISLHSTLQ